MKLKEHKFFAKCPYEDAIEKIEEHAKVIDPKLDHNTLGALWFGQSFGCRMRDSVIEAITMKFLRK